MTARFLMGNSQNTSLLSSVDAADSQIQDKQL